MVGRFTKYNGATEVIDRGASRPRPDELRRFKPDFYDPYRKPIRSPNLLQYKAERTFGKRIVEEAAKQVARRAPLALLGPLGDLLALGLISWDMYLLLLELQNKSNPVPPTTEPPAGGTSNPVNYDWTGWNVATTDSWPANFAGFGVTSFGTITWTPVGGSYVADTTPTWSNSLEGEGPNYQIGIGTTLEGWLSTHVNAGESFKFQNDYDAVDTDHFLEGPRHAWHGWYQRTIGGAAGDPLYIGFGSPLPNDLPLDWTEPDPNMKREMFPDGVPEPIEDSRDAPPPRWKPPRPSRPKRGTREAPKAQGPLQTIMKAMDIISEAAEFVDALYDALPDDVRKRWDEKGRGLMDNAGQYGIDGADWKLNALWHNWHKVDIEQAIKNIIANELQDKILGKYQQALPKNIGHVADAGSLGLNDLIDLFNRTVGLS